MIWSRAAYAALLLVPETIKVAKVALPEAGITAPPGQADDVQVREQVSLHLSLECVAHVIRIQGLLFNLC